MSGTKQIRVGSVARFVEKLKIRMEALEATRAVCSIDEGLLVRIDELERVIEALEKEFDL